MNRRFITSKSEKQALAFIEKLRHTATEDGLSYLATFKVSQRLWDIAESCGLGRQLLAEEQNLVGDKYDRRDPTDPSDAATHARNVHLHALGLLGELLLAKLLPRGAVITPLVAHKPDDKADAFFEELVIDCKTTDVGAKWVHVNGAAHCKKKPTHYFVVHLVRKDVADIYLATAGQVESWTYQSWRDAPCYTAKAPAIDKAALDEVAA